LRVNAERERGLQGSQAQHNLGIRKLDSVQRVTVGQQRVASKQRAIQGDLVKQVGGQFGFVGRVMAVRGVLGSLGT
jgi:hypothetical protein